MRSLLLIGLIFCFGASAQKYSLVQSKMTYKVTHTLKISEGISKEAKGKGLCDQGQCEFLVAVPVKSFDSGNSNRDLHMLQVTKGAAHPMIVARLKIAQSELAKESFPADVEVEAAGVKKVLHVNSVKRTGDLAVEFMLPFKLTDFGIERPSLLTVAVEDLAPVTVYASFQKE